MLSKQRSTFFVFNRTKAKADPVLEKGAKWASSPADIARQCTVTFSCVFSDDALKEVFEGWLSGKPQKGSIFVDCSTVYPDTIRGLDAKAQEAGEFASQPTGIIIICNAPMRLTHALQCLKQQTLTVTNLHVSKYTSVAESLKSLSHIVVRLSSSCFPTLTQLAKCIV